MPQAVAAVAAPLITAGQAERLVEGLEQVRAADEAESDDPRSDVRRRDQLDPLVGEPDAVGPAAEVDDLDDAYLPCSGTMATLPLAPPSIVA